MSSFALPIFYFFSVIAIFLGFTSLRGGVRFARYLRTESSRDYPEFTPFVTVFVPCRGLDPGLKENLAVVFAQDYPSFEIIFVSDSADDAALTVVEGLRRLSDEQGGPPSSVVIAGAAIDSGQKVHNLRVAVGEASPKSEVFAFVDTDARAHPRWLRSLVAPLRDRSIGATTGYRWFVPLRGNLASHLRSVWNASIASALGGLGEKNFCWGGSTALRRDTFESTSIAEAWRGTVSDDFAVTRVLRESGLPIKFMPQCLIASFEDCNSTELLEFTTRQLKVTRAYASHLWKGVLLSSLVFVIAFFGGIVLVVTRSVWGLSFAIPLVLVSVIFALGAVKSYLRLRAVRRVIYDTRLSSIETTLAHVTLWPFASLLFLFNSLAAAVSRRITWRGITYELNSPGETVIIRRDK